MGGIFGGKAPPPQTPITSNLYRFKNILLVHWRGLFGILIFPWILIPIMGGTGGDSKANIYKSIQAGYVYLISYFLFRPVALPVACTLPLFWFPLFFILTTPLVVKFYFGATAALMLIAGMFTLLANQTNLDKKVAYAIITFGSSYTVPMMIIKASVGAFISGLFSNSLISTQKVYDILMPAFSKIPSEVMSPAIVSMSRDLIFNTVQVSSTLASLVVLHNNFSILTFKAMYLQSIPPKAKDPINYLQYTAFVLPCAISILIVNIIYHCFLYKWQVSRGLSKDALKIVITEISKQKDKKLSAHQYVAILFLIVGYILMFFRDSPWTGSVWSTAIVRDVSIIAAVMILLHMLPRDLNFLKYFRVKKESELGTIKPSSAILWWRYVDRNTNYAYMLVLGCATCLWEGIAKHDFCKNIRTVFQGILDQGTKMSPMWMVIYSTVLSFLMPGPAVVIVLTPIILCMGVAIPSAENMTAAVASYAPSINMLKSVLAIAIASSFGFTTPFLYSPAYYCHFQARVRRSRMIFINLGMALLAAAVLWLYIIFLCPAIFTGPQAAKPEVAAGTGAAADAGAPAEAPPAEAEPPPA